ncbi:MAG: DUF1344 domain-containing protein [Mesorhizobium sp.]
MKLVLSSLIALFLASTAAFAANVEGTIKSIDQKSLTLTLDDGKKYKLSEEFNFEDYEAGQTVMIQYDEIKGDRIVLQIISD